MGMTNRAIQVVAGVLMMPNMMASAWYLPRNRAGNISAMYVLVTIVIAASPMPVRNRKAPSDTASQDAALSNENTEKKETDRIKALRRPTLSASRPPTIDPRNMPRKVSEVM